MRYVLIIAAALSLQGCWFVFIPGSVMGKAADAVTGNEGNLCVRENASIGDRVRGPIGMGTITKLEGTSTRCTAPEFPQRAVVLLDK